MNCVNLKNLQSSKWDNGPLSVDAPTVSCLSHISETECVTQVTSHPFLYHYPDQYGPLSAAVCESGRVYTFGRSNVLEWMLPNVSNDPVPVQGMLNKHITQAACGWETLYLVSKDKVLYSCGKNFAGQLGMGHKQTVSKSPLRVDVQTAVKKVAAGWDHAVLLNERGDVYVCGNNAYGQLGLRETTSTTRFTMVPDLPVVEDICTGERHIALLARPNVWVAGDNEYLQLGIKDQNKRSAFKVVPLPVAEIIALACGFEHTVALARDGSLWAWGRNDYGQLGYSEVSKASLPKRMLIPEGYTICGVTASVHHTALTTTQGEVLLCGRGSNYNHKINKPTILLLNLNNIRVDKLAFEYHQSFLYLWPRRHDTTVQTTPESAQFPLRDTLKIVDKKGIDSIKKCVQCPVCKKVLRAPIWQCVQGHSLCGECHSNCNRCPNPKCRKSFCSSHNYVLENVINTVTVPCQQCGQLISLSALDAHASSCCGCLCLKE